MGRTRRSKQASKSEDEGKGGEGKVQKEAPKQAKPIQKNPKKYVQKSIESLQRIERSKHQRIFLLSAQRNESSWNFTVQGTTGSQYHVQISTTVSCKCFDFKMKKKPCKHIFFIVTQVAQNDELLDYFRSSVAKISKAAYEVLDQQLTDRLRSRMNAAGKDAKEIDLKDDTDCTICFTEMDKENEKLEDCSTCKKYFHVVCLQAWKNHNPTCPLCRGKLCGHGNDPLGKLSGIKID